MSQADDSTPVMPGGGGGHGFVKPRASFEPGGAALPLVKLIEQHVGKKGIVYILGGTGSGKTWAVHYLRAALGADARVALFDEPGDPYWELEGLAPLVVIATSHGDQPNSRCVLHLSRWTDDDLIEFLLTGGHRAQVASVMKRVRADEGRGALLGNPRLWRIVLEEMLADERITRCAAALGKRLAGLEGSVRQSASTMALAAVRSDGIVKTDELPGDIAKLVRHPIVCELLAAERIVSDLECHQGARHLERSLPPQLVRQTGLLVRERLGAWRALATLLSGHYPQTDAMAASIMLAANPAWYPTVSRRMVHSGAMLAGALWSGVQLAEADLSLADLAGADLSRARLDRVRANGVDLSRANLAAATLTGAGAAQADFIDADLTAVVAHKATFSGADFTGAVLARADLLKAILCQCEMKGADLREAILRGADLSSARLEEADFTGADLTEVEMDGTDLSVAVWGATRFRRAKLRRCNLEGLDIPGAQFGEANLRDSYLTGSRMPGADFRSADLRDTGLADIDWPRADLRDADLRGCSFHMGSSRSGLVGSTIPCEGSRTGFYTDDYNDRDFKSPEEIRKANLCGADLRGANIDGVDFYLVDLRGASYTNRQAEQLARCGAILHLRVG